MSRFFLGLFYLVWFAVGLNLFIHTTQGDYGLWEILMQLPLLVLMSLVLDKVLLPDDD